MVHMIQEKERNKNHGEQSLYQKILFSHLIPISQYLCDSTMLKDITSLRAISNIKNKFINFRK